MNAEILSVGTELLLGEVLNSNAQFISQRLVELGIDVFFQTTVGDNVSRLRSAVETSMSRADILIFTGGLGPTKDDLTKETLASVLGLELVLREDVVAAIRQRFESRGLSMPESNVKQAMVPTGSLVFRNGRGTAPGVAVERQGKVFVLLPGPPGEMQPMFEEQVMPYLDDLLRRRGEGRLRLYSRFLRICGVGESSVESSVRDIIDSLAADRQGLTIAPYAKAGEVHLRLAMKAGDPALAEQRFSEVECAIRARLGNAVFGRDETTLEEACGRLLSELGETVAIAESCTGGMVSSRMVNVPGSSRYYRGGIVAYSNEVKESLLGVPREVLERHGAVSAQTATAMARGVKESLGSDWGVGVTGVAGPGGGSSGKPVGTVFFSLCSPSGECVERGDLFWGSRKDIRHRTAQYALALLWNELCARASEPGGERR